MVVSNRFSLKTSIDEPMLAFLIFGFKPTEEGGKPRYQNLPVFLEPGEITMIIKDSIALAKHHYHVNIRPTCV